MNIFKKNTTQQFISLFILFCILGTVFPLPAHAQSPDSLSLTITPPLFQLTIGPGESWASTIKVVNSNSYDVTLYSSVMNFSSEGENGQGRLTPVIRKESGENSNTLAEWIQVSAEPFLVPKEKSYEVPFSIQIPKDAPPGGHYAAVLIGTEPLTGGVEGAAMTVSSQISSLFFVRIKGDTKESGRIQSLKAEHYFYFHQNPEVKLSLQFKNDGNVHLQPKGEIDIFSMWGKKMASIPVNQKTSFGNVLPNSTRTYEFIWQADESILDFGFYKAIATITFGEDEHQNEDITTSFWIVPLKPLLILIGIFLIFIFITTLIIRRYIRKSLGTVGAVITKKEVSQRRRI